jgi:hypothetical protein
VETSWLKGTKEEAAHLMVARKKRGGGCGNIGARPHLLIAHSAINSPFDQSSEVSTLII